MLKRKSLFDSARKKTEGERGGVLKEFGGRLAVAVLFPNIYYAGMSNLALHLLYARINRLPWALAERLFLPDKEEIEAFSRLNIPLFTLESRRAANEFHIIAVTIPYEPDLLNLARILSLAHISPKANERIDRDPIVIGGGAALFLNARPAHILFDLIALGDAEGVIEELCEVVRSGIQEGISRKEIIAAASVLPGVYRPGMDEIPEPNRHPDLSDDLTRTHLFTEDTDFSNSCVMELGRGCSYRCKFCTVRAVYDPLRYRRTDAVHKMIDAGFRITNRFGLMGASVAKHPNILEITDRILAEGGKFSLSSLRFEDVTEALLENMAKSGTRTITLAPETGLDSMRERIGKAIPREIILEKIAMLKEAGIPRLRLYFMIGLPDERNADIRGVSDLVKEIASLLQLKPRDRNRLAVIMSCFVPRPLTEMADAPFAGKKIFKRRTRKLEDYLKKTPVKLVMPNTKEALLQNALAHGGEELGDLLVDPVNPAQLLLSFCNGEGILKLNV